MAARVVTTFDQYVNAPAGQVYADLCDWDDHPRWLPLTRVTVHSPDEFTARTGVGPLGVTHRMRVLARVDDTRDVTLAELGTFVRGTTSFSVRPFDDETCVVRWQEDVTVAGLPASLGRPLSAVVRFLFRKALRRLPR